MKKKETKNISLRVSKELFDKLFKIQQKQKRGSISNVACLAIEEGVKILEQLPDFSEQLKHDGN